MTTWMRRARGALGLGIVWALAWAPVAVLFGLVIDPDGSMDEMWPAIGAYPGFLCGVTFAVVLGIVERRRRLADLSLPRIAAWGALGGLLVGVVPFLIGQPAGDTPVGLLAGIFVGSSTLLGAASASGSLALARRGTARPPASLAAGELRGNGPERAGHEPAVRRR